MHKSQFILLCVIVLVLGARTAKAQDGVDSLDDQIQNKYSEREPDKSATTHQKDKTQAKNNDDGHRKHWWSLPHFRHKKKDENATNQIKIQPKRHTLTASSKGSKPASQKHVAKNNAPTERSKRKALTAAKPSHQTVAKSNTGTATAGRAHKKTVSSSGHAKEVHQNCSSAEAKKGGCQNVQRRNSKADTSAT